MAFANPPSHCLLVSHGSRDPRSTLAFQTLVRDIQQFLPRTQIFSGVLELSDRTLHEQIIAIVEREACPTLTLLPLFLQPGTHVLEDLPAEIAKAQAYLGSDRRAAYPIQALPFLGATPALLNILQTLCTPPQTWILLAHGSSRAATQTFFADLHHTLGTHAAYWHHPPALSNTVHTLVAAGSTQIGVLPYFLFPGKIPDTILQTLQPLKDQYRHVEFSDRLLLSQQPGFAALIAQLLCKITELKS
ncbi:MAG: sirohydrochlorin chelatase [Prochlorotrichaceae cyanobacterium]|jgi:sirohydrochlorin cobaltochelatase